MSRPSTTMKPDKATITTLAMQKGSVVQSQGSTVVSRSRSIQLLIRHSRLVKMRLYRITSNIVMLGDGGSDSRTVGRKAEQATIKVAMLAMRPANPKSWKKMASVMMASSNIGRKTVRTVVNGYRYIANQKCAYCQFLTAFCSFFQLSSGAIFLFRASSNSIKDSSFDGFFPLSGSGAFLSSSSSNSFMEETYLAPTIFSASPYSPKSQFSCRENLVTRSPPGLSIKFILTVILVQPWFQEMLLSAKVMDSSRTSKGVRKTSHSISKGNLFLHWTVYSPSFSSSVAVTLPSSRLRCRLGSGSRLQNISLLTATSRFFLIQSIVSRDSPLQQSVRMTVALISAEAPCTSSCVIFLNATRRYAGRNSVFLLFSLTTRTVLLYQRSFGYFLSFFLSLLILQLQLQLDQQQRISIQDLKMECKSIYLLIRQNAGNSKKPFQKRIENSLFLQQGTISFIVAHIIRYN